MEDWLTKIAKKQKCQETQNSITISESCGAATSEDTLSPGNEDSVMFPAESADIPVSGKIFSIFLFNNFWRDKLLKSVAVRHGANTACYIYEHAFEAGNKRTSKLFVVNPREICVR